MKWCISANACSCTNIGTGIYQHLSKCRIAFFGCPVKSRHTVTLRFIYVGAGAKKSPYTFYVSCFRS